MIAPSRRKNARSAFTLTEVLVVVAIIVVLAGVAVPITLNVLGTAKRDVAEAKAKSLVGHVRGWAARNNEIPVSIEVLLAPSVDPNGRGSLTLDAIMDPWNQPYQLITNGDDPDTFTFIIRSGGAGTPIEVPSQ